MAEKKGICKNYVNCPLADKEEVQVVDDLNFVCAHCHQPLQPVEEGSGGGKGVDPNKKRLLILIIAALALIGLIVGGIFFINSNKAKKQAEAERAAFVADSLRQVAAEEQRIADSIRLAEEQAAEEARLAEEQEAEALRLAEEQRIADSIRVADSIRIADSIAAAKNKKTDKPAQSSGSSNWNGVASYSGPMQGGQPNGIGGKLTFKSNYSLDLKDGKGTKLDIKAGETIENTKFENGKLRQGELHRKDGTRKWFNI